MKNTHASTIPGVNQQLYNSNPFFVFGGKMYYANNDGLKGREPWVTDGTVAGTRLLADVNSGTLGSISLWNPGYSLFQGKMFFRAFDGTNVQICQADTLNNTFAKFPVTSGFFSAELPYDLQLTDDESFAFHAFNGQLFFPGGFHPTSADPFAFSHDFFKLAPVTSVGSPVAKELSVRIFPNPVHHWLQVESEIPLQNIKVCNGLGQEMKSVIRNGNAMDVSQLSAGMYFLKISSTSGTRVQQFIKE